jgi:hypothetical protein
MLTGVSVCDLCKYVRACIQVCTSISVRARVRMRVCRYSKLKKGYLTNGFNREVQRLEKSFQWWIVWIGGLSVIIACSSIIATAYNIMNIVCNLEEDAITGMNDATVAFTSFAFILHLLRFMCVLFSSERERAKRSAGAAAYRVLRVPHRG